MESLRSALTFLLPWEFSPWMLVLCAGALVLYTRGLRRMPERVGVARPLVFYIGVVLIYFVTQTHYDYLAQHMFFIHRLQHLVLHHLGPFLVAISWPQAVLARGLPDGFVERWLRPVWRHPAVHSVYRVLQHPLVAPTLFVGLIYLWLTPAIHFDAMLNERLYWTMNWSMLLDGLPFWFLMLDPRTREQGALIAIGPRMAIQWIVILPQIAIGAYIVMAHHELYDVYSICGRAWAEDPLTDQELGGLITWIPAGMMHLIGFLVLMRFWMRTDKGRIPVAESAALAHPVRD
jgi:putative membrane protein